MAKMDDSEAKKQSLMEELLSAKMLLKKVC